VIAKNKATQTRQKGNQQNWHCEQEGPIKY
jgi:hypothetical protein